MFLNTIRNYNVTTQILSFYLGEDQNSPENIINLKRANTDKNKKDDELSNCKLEN